MAGPGGVTGPGAVGAGPGPGAVTPGAGAPGAAGADAGVASDDEQATARSAATEAIPNSEKQERPIQAVENLTVTQA